MMIELVDDDKLVDRCWSIYLTRLRTVPVALLICCAEYNKPFFYNLRYKHYNLGRASILDILQ